MMFLDSHYSLEFNWTSFVDLVLLLRGSCSLQLFNRPGRVLVRHVVKKSEELVPCLTVS